MRLKLLSVSYKEEKGKAQDLLGRMKSMHGELMRMEELARAHAARLDEHPWPLQTLETYSRKDRYEADREK